MRLTRRALRTGGALLTAALVTLAVGAAFGRWRVLPVNAAGVEAGVDRGTLVFATPVPAPSIKQGDLVFMRFDTRDRGSVRRVVDVVDSWQGALEVDGVAGVDQTVRLSATAWRIDRQVPYAGYVLRALAGPVQSILLVLNGIAMVAWSTASKKRTPPASPDAGPRRRLGMRRLRRPQARARAAAAVAVAGGRVQVAGAGMR